MSDPCTVLIAAADLLPALKQRAISVNGEVLTFSDADVLRALEVIMTRRPGLVALERLFAATPRGVALIDRIKADPTLFHSEIRVVSHDSDESRVLIARAAPGSGGNAGAGGSAAGTAAGGIVALGAATSGSSAARSAAVVTAPASLAAAPGSAFSASTKPASAAPSLSPLDKRGTRRAPRFKIAPPLDVLVDGNAATLIDLSTMGAQVVSKSVIKPNQRVRMAFNDEQMTLRFNAAVAWAWFEIPPQSGPCYRAGIEFVDADQRAVEAFCVRHRK